MEEHVRESSTTKLSRRHFVRNSSIALGALSGLSFLAACDSGGSETDSGMGSMVEEGPDGKWISAACWENCGGRCVNKVLIKDGVVVRQGTDDSHEDSWDWIQQRGCPRGRSSQQLCFGEARLQYPMKRKSWEPGGGANANGEMRGKDEWVRISWDEAVDYITSEATRIYDTYGPRAVLGTGGTGVDRILAAMGGYIGITDSSSCGVFSFNVTKFGLPGWGLGETNDRYDLKNAETIIMIGGNPAWSSGGSTMYNYKEAMDAGVEFIMVGPSYNATASFFESRWVPAYPGTDTALLLGIAYEMIQLDNIDYDFISKYTVGFDADHMPANAKINENFKDYLLGAYDETPKTAEWASAICGTPVEDIRFLAEKLGKDNKVMLLHNYALARSVNTEDIPQLIMTVGAMGGHMGKSGHATGCGYKTFAGANGAQLVNHGESGDVDVENPVGEFIAAPALWQSILDGKYNFAAIYYGDFFPEDIREIDIKYVNFEIGSKLQNTPNMLTGITALRQMEFVTCSAHFFDAQAKYADIVLPLTHQWERVGMFPGHQRSRETLIVCTNVTERPFECKSDQEIGELLAAKLELDVDEIYPLDEKQQFFNQILGATVVEEDGMTEVPLVTITQEDLDEWECAGEPQEGKVELKQFLADGVYQIKRSEGDNYGYIGYQAFVEDPKANPREDSESGLLEIYCDYKSDTINSMGYSASDHFKPYPSYTVSPQGREATFVDSVINGEKSEYPFILYNPHYLRRSHPVFDNAPWLREAWPNPVYLSAMDAAEKGIVSGDTVKVYTAAGATLRTAAVTQTIMPGCVALPHGAWVDYDEELGVDKAGTDNVIGSPVMNGIGVSGYNNINCNYEKYDGEALVPDAELPPRIVDLG